jgi:putative ABC transport system permease protein
VNFLESLRIAFVALVANKLRSVLTMLGVIIGVGAVIIMISIIQGARQKVISNFRGNGADIVFTFYSPKREGRIGGSFDGLTLDDVKAIERRVTQVDVVIPRLEEPMRALNGKKTYNMQAVGATERYLDVAVVDMEEGRFIDNDDNRTWAQVCILGDKVRHELFADNENPIGKSVTIAKGDIKVPMTVIGLLKRKGNANFGTSVDEQVMMPYETMRKRLSGSRNVAAISARSLPGQSEEAANQIFAVLKQLHPNNIKDFIVDTQEGLIKQLDQVLMLFQIVMGGVGGLSLLVGGIGIMNIMLVSVTERTREIGIRKAVGAKRASILVQFLIESMTVSGFGGLLGVGFGYATATAIGIAAKDQLPTYVPPWAAFMGFGFAVAVGMFFGIYPAVQASKLDPINALRYE